MTCLKKQKMTMSVTVLQINTNLIPTSDQIVISYDHKCCLSLSTMKDFSKCDPDRNKVLTLKEVVFETSQSLFTPIAINKDKCLWPLQHCNRANEMIGCWLYLSVTNQPAWLCFLCPWSHCSPHKLWPSGSSGSSSNQKVNPILPLLHPHVSLGKLMIPNCSGSCSVSLRKCCT